MVIACLNLKGGTGKTTMLYFFSRDGRPAAVLP